MQLLGYMLLTVITAINMFLYAWGFDVMLGWYFPTVAASLTLLQLWGIINIASFGKLVLFGYKTNPDETLSEYVTRYITVMVVVDIAMFFVLGVQWVVIQILT